MTDPPDLLEIEEPDPRVRRGDQPPSQLEEAFDYDPRGFQFPKQRDRPLKAGVVVGGLGCLWLFFGVLAMVFFGPLIGPKSATLVGTLLWLICLGGWTLLVGGRAFWMGSWSPVEMVWSHFLRRTAEVPTVNEAPAQLLRKRGQGRAALAMYEGWSREHPKLAILWFRMAEIQHHDLNDRPAAGRLYAEFLSRVRERGYRPSQEERDNVGIAEGLAKELREV